MKNLKKTATLTAPSLMIDDHFELGGLMYRITGIEKNDYGDWIIRFHLAKKPRRWKSSTLIVPADTEFTIYNQK